jgi:ABC-2 type transport system permease protein
MRLRRLKAIAAKEVLQIWRDPRSLMIALLLPFTLMFLFGYGVNLDLKHFQASLYFAIARNVSTYDDMVAAIDRADCSVGFVVPPDFSQRLNDTGAASVQAILDGTDDNTANIAWGYASAVVSGYSNDVAMTAIDRQGRTLQRVQPLVVQSRVWFNEDLDSRNFIVPGMIAVIMALVGAQLTSLTIAREWERGTMELLVSTPVTSGEVMFGKLAPYLLIGWIDAALCLVLAAFWFEVPFRGALTTLFLTTTVYLIVVLSIGYLLSVLIRTQVGASQIALVATLMPAMLLSGYVFPIDQMPAFVQDVTYVVFSRYYVTILKAIFLKGSHIADLLSPVLFLVVYALVLVLFAGRAFRKRLV